MLFLLTAVYGFIVFPLRPVLLVGGKAIKVTASLGIAAYPRDEISNVEQLVNLADEALYRAKAAGRNQVAIAA